MSDILVTGATGFLGKHLLDRLEAKNVRVLVRKPTKRLARLGVEVTKADVLDEDELARATQGVKQIYHLAGLVSRNPDDAHVMYRVHVDGTRAVLQAAAKAKVGRVVVASTSGTVACSSDPDRI